MYINLNEDNTVREIIPDFDPRLPGFPIEKRYPAAFVENLLHVPDNTEVQQNWVYDPESETFAPPPEPEPVEIEPESSDSDGNAEYEELTGMLKGGER